MMTIEDLREIARAYRPTVTVCPAGQSSLQHEAVPTGWEQMQGTKRYVEVQRTDNGLFEIIPEWWIL